MTLLARTSSGMTIRGEPPRYKEIEVRDGDKLWSGNMFKVEFKLKNEAYVYVLSLDSLGNLAMLYPDRDSKVSTKFKPNEVYIIPMKDKWFRLDDNTGKETVYLISTLKAIENIEERNCNAEKAGTR